MQVIIDFIVELIRRWFAPTPTFFKTLRTIAVIIGIITAIEPILSMFDVQFHWGISVAIQKVISVVAFVSAVVAQLTVENPVKADLPYTAKKEGISK